MEHSTCTLDISSDEESAARLKDSRGKENVPPPDDVSQTRTFAGQAQSMTETKARMKNMRRRQEEDAIEVDRCPLGEMPAEDFYAEGCDAEAVFLVNEGEDETDHEENHPAAEFDFLGGTKGKGRQVDVDALMQKDDFEPGRKAALLEPIEKAEEGFDVWESGSAQGDE